LKISGYLYRPFSVRSANKAVYCGISVRLHLTVKYVDQVLNDGKRLEDYKLSAGAMVTVLKKVGRFCRIAELEFW
jgi:hypothetical protein